jgi:Flp pilus assembly protein TadD
LSARRRRFLRITTAGVVVFLLGVAATLWIRAGEQQQYVPGAALEGLTDTLGRNLPADRPDVRFTDVTDSAGIRFRHFSGQRTSRLPEDMGSGAAWGDYDKDGWLDLYVANQSGPLTLSPAQVAASPAHAVLYHNRGDGTFEDVSEAAGVAFRGTGMGVAWGDCDNDGWPDLLLTTYGGLVLYHNRGNGTFEDITARAGLAGFHGFWTGVAWADYNRDGHLDAYIGGYVQFEDRPNAPASRQYNIVQPASLNPASFPAERNLLLRNRGHCRFTDVAGEAGVADPQGRSLSVAWADLDEDGWPDLYVANDLSDNVLFRNRRNRTFQDISHTAAVADYRGAMGLAIGDWDGDGDEDIFITHWLAQENALYDNELRRAPGDQPPPGASLWFTDDADRFGLGQVALDFVGWGTSFFDYDNDGRPDLMVVNGSTIEKDSDRTQLVPMRDQLLWNGGPTRGFFDVSSVAGPYFARALVGRGATFGDYDNDGDVDVFIVNNDGPGVLLRNDGGNKRPWFAIGLEGRKSNRSAVGARVRLVAGGVAQVQELGAQPSYLSQDSPILHFGLGSATAVDTLEVRWPSGKRQVFTSLPARARFHVIEAEQPVQAATVNKVSALPEDERQRVRDFWTSYREATQERVAGQRELAAASYRKALAFDPKHEDVLYYLGNVLFDLDSLDAARRMFARLVEVNPRSARGHARLGVVYLCSPTLGPVRVDDAEQEFRAAADLNREETGPYVRLAEVALLRGDARGATRALETVLGSNSKSAAANFLLGYQAWLGGRRTLAAQSFRTALEAGAPSAETESTNPCDALLALHGYLGEPGDTADTGAMDRRYTAFRAGLERLGLGR